MPEVMEAMLFLITLKGSKWVPYIYADGSAPLSLRNCGEGHELQHYLIPGFKILRT